MSSVFYWIRQTICFSASFFFLSSSIIWAPATLRPAFQFDFARAAFTWAQYKFGLLNVPQLCAHVSRVMLLQFSFEPCAEKHNNEVKEYWPDVCVWLLVSFSFFFSFFFMHPRSGRSGKIRVQSMKIGLLSLCKGHLEEKYKCKYQCNVEIFPAAAAWDLSGNPVNFAPWLPAQQC